MRALVLPCLALLLAACPPTSNEDYFNLAVGYTWEFYLLEGGEDGEFWTVQALDADENTESGRGDIYFRLTRTIPDGLGPGTDQVLEQRRFNVRHVQDLTGSEPVSIGWDYRWVLQEEGEREEYFLRQPGSAKDWSDGWDYETGEPGGSDFEHTVEMATCTEPVATSAGEFEDCVTVTRTVEVTNYDINGNPEDPLTTVHTEVWARDVGLASYEILASDLQRSYAVLRTTNAMDDDE